MPTSGFYVVALPELDRKHSAWIDSVRKDHDPLAYAIPAHFTLVFAIDGLSQADLTAHLSSVVRRVPRIAFRCSYVMLGRDHQDPVFYAFLVPDQGFGAISRLRDTLHTAQLADHLRPEIPFVPHITLGRDESASAAKDLCTRLNDESPQIDGWITALTLIEAANDEIKIHQAFALKH
ncbi:MAG: 2'-5' RNA ligase family protein [Pseudomonadota bacterium]